MKFHLIGIKGSGMSALAQILRDLGHFVHGVDYNIHYFTEKKLDNIDVYGFGYIEEETDFTIIVGNAYIESEYYQYYTDHKYTVISYPDFIQSYIIGNKRSIAVSGSHGKTTITKLLSHIFSLSKNIISLVGDGTGYAMKNSEYFIFEACEYKDTFLQYSPSIAIINNISLDHTDYFKTFHKLKESFVSFYYQSESVYINPYEETTQFMMNKQRVKLSPTYEIIEENKKGFFVLIEWNSIEYTLHIPLLGKHNLNNAMIAIGVALDEGVPFSTIRKAIRSFEMPNRRYQKHVINNQVIIDDYAHHPEEISALYDALNQEYPSYKKIIIFQPHTLERTLYFNKQFVRVLQSFDHVYIDEIFSSVREEETDRNPLLEEAEFEAYSLDKIKKFHMEKNTIIAFVGAGDIGEQINKLMDL